MKSFSIEIVVKKSEVPEIVCSRRVFLGGMAFILSRSYFYGRRSNIRYKAKKPSTFQSISVKYLYLKQITVILAAVLN